MRRRFATEAVALEIAARHRVKAPRLVAADADGSEVGVAVLVMTVLPGTSRIARGATPNGYGRAGVDLGSLRCDAAVMYGPEAADDVLRGWEAAAGEPASNLPWWDLISALSTPPDMGVWLPNFHAQGRTDLTLALVTRRRDAYLAAALRNL